MRRLNDWRIGRSVVLAFLLLSCALQRVCAAEGDAQRVSKSNVSQATEELKTWVLKDGNEAATRRAKAIAKTKSERTKALIPWLVQTSSSKAEEFDVRGRALCVLAWIMKWDRSACKPLIHLLLDEHRLVRNGASAMLPYGYSYDADEIRLLAEVLGKSSDSGVRDNILIIYSDLEEKVAPAIPMLARIAKDKGMPGRYSAVKALARMGTPTKAILLGFLESSDAELRRCAARHLLRTGAAYDPKVVERAIRLLKDEDWHVRHSVVLSLPRKGPTAELVIPALLELIRVDKDTEIRVAAISVVRQMGICRKTVADTLVDACGDPSVPVQANAMGALDVLGPGIVPFMIEALDRKDNLIRGNLVHVLGGIRPVQVQAIPLLLEIAKDTQEDEFVRISALHSIGQMDSKAKATVSAVRAIYAQSDSGVKAAAGGILVSYGEKPKGIVQVLSSRLEKAFSREKVFIIRSLIHLGPAAKAAVPALQQLLKDDQWMKEACYVDPRTMRFLVKGALKSICEKETSEQ